MDEAEKNSDATRSVRADRLSTEDKAGSPSEEEIRVIEEAPLTIDVEGVENFTLLCTPTDGKALALGFLFSEGVIESMTDVKVLKECDDDSRTIRVRLTRKVPRIGDPGRNLLIVSSCGACGSENLKDQIAALPLAGDTLKIQPDVLRSVYQALRKRQSLFEACGATHAAAVFDPFGKIVSCAEDVGRHNALDKAIGKCILDGIRTAGLGAAVTSRLSLEMVSKCARAGIELVAAVSAPTTMAIDTADTCNITLCAFVRDTRATVFTHPGRLIDARK
jgi:FdhD protein